MDFYSNNIYKRMAEKLSLIRDNKECIFTPNLLSGKIIERYNCFYFESLAPKYTKAFSMDFDHTENECSYNKIFIGSIIEGESKEQKFECGIFFAQKLAEKLLTEFGTGFNVIFSFDMENSFVRFHKIRDGERWLKDDLESYKMDAILKIVV